MEAGLRRRRCRGRTYFPPAIASEAVKKRTMTSVASAGGLARLVWNSMLSPGGRTERSGFAVQVYTSWPEALRAAKRSRGTASGFFDLLTTLPSTSRTVTPLLASRLMCTSSGAGGRGGAGGPAAAGGGAGGGG